MVVEVVVGLSTEVVVGQLVVEVVVEVVVGARCDAVAVVEVVVGLSVATNW